MATLKVPPGGPPISGEASAAPNGLSQDVVRQDGVGQDTVRPEGGAAHVQAASQVAEADVLERADGRPEVTRPRDASTALLNAAAVPEHKPLGPGDVVAKLGDTELREPEIERALGELELGERIGVELWRFSRRFGLSQREGESQSAFLERLRSELPAPRQAELKERLDATRKEARDEAVLLLLQIKLGQQMVEDLGGTAPEEGTLYVQRELVLAELATLYAAQNPDVTNLDEALTQELTQRVVRALWAPHQRSVDDVLTSFPRAGDRDVVRFELAMHYWPQHGIDAPAEIARQVRQRGGVTQLINLIDATQQTSGWSVAQLRVASVSNPELAPLVNLLTHENSAHPLGILTPEPRAAGMTAAVSPVLTPALLQSIDAGERWFGWRATPEGGFALGLLGETPLGVDQVDSAAQAAASLQRTVEQIGTSIIQAWDQGSPTLQELISTTGLEPLVGDDLPVLVRQTPQLRSGLETALTRAAIDGATWPEVRERAQQLGLDADWQEELQDAWQRVHGMFALRPPPESLARALRGEESLILPLTPGAALTTEQEEAVASLKAYLRFASSETHLSQGGGVDDTLRSFLSGWNPAGRGATEIQLDQASLAPLLGRLAASAPDFTEERTLGELLLSHPAVRARTDVAGGSRVHPVRLAVAYAAELGHDVRYGADESLALALLDSAAHPVDERALRRAVRSARALPPPPALEDVLTTRVLIASDDRRSVSLVPAFDAADRARSLAKLLPLTEDTFSSEVSRSSLGFLPLFEPIAALRIAAAHLDGRSLPIDAGGQLSGMLTADDLRSLKNHRHGLLNRRSPEDEALAASRWDQVIEWTEAGQLVLGDITQDVAATDTEFQNTVNAILSELRGMGEALRMNTLPTDRAQVAVAENLRTYDPVVLFPDPMGKAREVLGLRSSTSATLTPSDLDAVTQLAESLRSEAAADPEEPGDVVHNAMVQFLKHYDSATQPLGETSALQAVQQAVHEGRITRSKDGLQVQPPDSVLQSQVDWVRDLVVEAADVIQAKHRRANREDLSPQLYRGWLEAKNHLFRLPGFADSVAFNSVEDWLVISLKAQMAQGGAGPKPEVSSAAAFDQWNDPAAASAHLTAHYSSEEVLADKRELSHIDGDLLDYLVANHEDLLGQSEAETVIAGIPQAMPSNSESVDLLRRLAAEMRSGDRPEWTSLNVTLQDTEEATRQAKAVVQSALHRLHAAESLFAPAIGGRNVASTEHLAQRLLGLEGRELAPLLKSFLVREGLANLVDVGDFKDTDISPNLLHRIASVAERAGAGAGETTQRELAEAAATLRTAATAGQSVSIAGQATSTEEARALRSVVHLVVQQLGSAGETQALSFETMLGHISDSLTVHSIPGNVIRLAGPELSAAAVIDGLGTQLPGGEQLRQRMGRWSTRVEFEPKRYVQTTVGSYILFKHLMHTMISYDMVVAPSVKGGKAAGRWMGSWSNGGGASERREAEAEMIRAVQQPVNLLAMLTAFRTPVGFAEDIWDQVEQGNLDMAAGKATVFYPMMVGATYGSYFIVRGAAGRLVELAGRRPLYMAVAETGGATPRSSTPAAQNRWARLRAPAGYLARGAGRMFSVVRDPKGAMGEGIRGLSAGRPLRADGWRSTGRLGFGALAVSSEQLRWVAQNPGQHLRLSLVRGGRVFDFAFSNQQLVESARSGTLSPDITRQLKRLPGRHQNTVRSALLNEINGLHEIEKTARGPVAANTGPTLQSLARNPAGHTTWEVGGRSYSLRNSDVVRATHARVSKGARAVDKVAQTIRTASGEAVSGEVLRSVSDRFMAESPSRIAALNREAFGRDAGHRVSSRVKKSTGVAPDANPGESKPTAPASEPAPTQTSTAGAATPAEPAPFRAVVGEAGVALEQLRQSQQRLAAAEAAGTSREVSRLRGDVIRKRRAFQSAVRQASAAIDAAPGETTKQRLRNEGARARLATIRLQNAFLENGVRGVNAEIVRASGQTLRGMSRSPAFYMILAVEGQHVLVELGHAIHDEQLSTAAKAAKVLGATVESAVRAGALTAGFAALQRVAPRLARGVGTSGGVLLAVNAEDLISQVADALAGYQPADEAMRTWDAVGIPETAQLRLVDDTEESWADWIPFVHSGDNDLGSLRHNKGNLITPRTQYWYFDGQSPLHQRLNQLGVQIRKPQELDLSKVTSFVEPAYQSLTVLQNLESFTTLTEDDELPRFNEIEGAMGFDYCAWEESVRTAAENLVNTVDLGPVTSVQLGDSSRESFEEFRGILSTNVDYGSISDEDRATLDGHILQQWEQARRWNLILDSLNIPQKQKEEALVQLVINLAGNQVVGGIVQRYRPIYNSSQTGWLKRVIPDTSIEDSYTKAPFRLVNNAARR